MNQLDDLAASYLFQPTTVGQRPVAAEAVGPDSAAPEQLRPVHRVVVAQLAVLTDVHAAVADLPEGAQTQRGQSGDAHHHEGKSPLKSTDGHVSVARHARCDRSDTANVLVQRSSLDGGET